MASKTMIFADQETDENVVTPTEKLGIQAFMVTHLAREDVTDFYQPQATGGRGRLSPVDEQGTTPNDPEIFRESFMVPGTGSPAKDSVTFDLI